MKTFRAIVVEKTDTGQAVAVTDFTEADLMDGDVTVRVEPFDASTTRTGSRSPARRRWCAACR